jgi:hypothetical protein
MASRKGWIGAAYTGLDELVLVPRLVSAPLSVPVPTLALCQVDRAPFCLLKSVNDGMMAMESRWAKRGRWRM